MQFILRLLTWWNGQTVGTALFTRRKGVKVGEDSEGNVFYQTRDGKRRWVIYNGYSEASRVDPAWHGWLHHTWDEPPTNRPLPRKAWEKPHVANMTGSGMAYAPTGSLRNPDSQPRQDYEPWAPE